MHTRRIPFREVHGVAIMMRIIRGMRPERPDPERHELPMSDEMWTLVQKCWHQDPKVRPPMSAVLESLSHVITSEKNDMEDSPGHISLPVRTGFLREAFRSESNTSTQDSAFSSSVTATPSEDSNSPQSASFLDIRKRTQSLVRSIQYWSFRAA
jgi:hypothetical protein